MPDNDDDEAVPESDLRATADAPEPEETDDDEVSQPGGLGGRIRSLRQRLAERRARRGSKKLQKKARSRKRKERVKDAVAPNTDADEAEDEAKLLAAELGISRERAENVTENATDLLERAKAAGGDAVAQLDTDGDGDTDILDAIESEAGGQGGREGPIEAAEPPVGDVEDDFDELGLTGIEENLGLDEPIEEQQDGGLF